MARILPIVVIVVSTVSVFLIYFALAPVGRQELLVESGKLLVAGGIGGCGAWWFQQWARERDQEREEQARAREARATARKALLNDLLGRVVRARSVLNDGTWYRNAHLEWAGESLEPLQHQWESVAEDKQLLPRIIANQARLKALLSASTKLQEPELGEARSRAKQYLDDVEAQVLAQQYSRNAGS